MSVGSPSFSDRISFRFMYFSVNRFIRKQLQIFRSIIIFDTINMMNNLFFFKKSFKFLFHNQTTSFYISTYIRKGVFRHINKGITKIIFNYSAFPFMVIFSFGSKFMSFFEFSFGRNMLSFFDFCFRRIMFPFLVNISTFTRTEFLICINPRQKFFFTIQTFFNNFSHFILQIKKAVFSVLLKMRLSIFRLLTAYNYKKIATSIANISISYLILLSITKGG